MIHPDVHSVMRHKIVAFPVCAADLTESTTQPPHWTNINVMFLHMRKASLMNAKQIMVTIQYL